MNPFQSAVGMLQAGQQKERDPLASSMAEGEGEGEGIWHCIWKATLSRRRGGIREGKEGGGGAKRQRSCMVRHGRQDPLDGPMMKE